MHQKPTRLLVNLIVIIVKLQFYKAINTFLEELTQTELPISVPGIVYVLGGVGGRTNELVIKTKRKYTKILRIKNLLSRMLNYNKKIEKILIKLYQTIQ